jgi:hypothetical protein
MRVVAEGAKAELERLREEFAERGIPSELVAPPPGRCGS